MTPKDIETASREMANVRTLILSVYGSLNLLLLLLVLLVCTQVGTREFRISRDGQSFTISSSEVVTQFRQNGEKVNDVSPDGKRMTLVNRAGGEFQVLTEDALKELGWSVDEVLANNIFKFKAVHPGFGGVTFVIASFLMFILSQIFIAFVEIRYVRSFFLSVLGMVEVRFLGSALTPEIVRNKYGHYALYKSLMIVQRQRRIAVFGLVVMGFVGISLILPPLIVAYLAYVRYFSIQKQTAIEEKILEFTKQHPVALAILSIEHSSQFNQVLTGILNMSGERGENVRNVGFI